MQLSDQELIRMLHRGDLKGYEMLFQRYYMRILLFVRGVIHSEWASEDIAQNVFMKIWMKRDSLYGESIDHLLFTMARHEIMDYFRSQVYSSRYRTSVMTFSERSDSFEADFQAAELADVLDKTVGELSDRRREIYCLSRRENLSNKQIAERLQLSVRTVEKHLEMALRYIRERLNDSYK